MTTFDRFLIGRMAVVRGPAFLCSCALALSLLGPRLTVAAIGADSTRSYTLENERVRLSVTASNDRLLGDRLEFRTMPADRGGTKRGPVVVTDAGFSLDVMYTDWQAPGKANNAENPILLTKKDFALVGETHAEKSDGSREMALRFRSRESTLELEMTYRLGRNETFVRRGVAVMDTAFGHHFLRWIWARDGTVHGVRSVVKAGGFGQPVALLVENGGVFFGLEYPASENRFEEHGGHDGALRCGQEYGEKIGRDWLKSNWVVEGLSPDADVKKRFLEYIDLIRVVPLRPYTLYNSWYDLRSPEYPRVSKDHWMSEQSAMGMVKLLRQQLIEKHDIKLDAFVLDDGWDVYESDWKLRDPEWPSGLKPLADELKKTNTSLGIWMGPTGGYSFRMRRIEWMKAHGYEVVGTSKDNLMLCLAGTNYSALFKKRTTDFVAEDGVGYFKWDGIQFSCSEPGHGHPVDVYSRRAVMESVIEKCRVVRALNPNMFLNITSGTWLSPWWVQYANTIWMQGADYGFSDVPSISRRDGAITYRDFILYDDFRNLDFWFPIQNLMTHGIIKGKLESTGSPDEPLDKFTDDALLYCARGVTMYELYISPDILSDGEWNSLAASLSWARDRFQILSTTSMIGGNPMKREPYGYVHFRGTRGIVAARNPFITPGRLEAALSSAQGLDPAAADLVVEQVYPTCMIAPRLYRAGENFTILLDGYETAVYEIYPVNDAAVPLLAGVSFDVVSQAGNTYVVRYHSASPGARLLNPSIVESMTASGPSADPRKFSPRTEPGPPVVSDVSVRTESRDPAVIRVAFDLPGTSREAAIAVLLTPDDSLSPKKKPALSAVMDGRESAVKTEEQEGRSQWYQVNAAPGRHAMEMTLKPGKDERGWSGEAHVWLISRQEQRAKEASFVLHKAIALHPRPPHPWKEGEVRRSVKLGEARLKAGPQ